MQGTVQYGVNGEPSWAPQEEPGFFNQLMQQGVLGMPVSEAMLRFGSGLLSGNNWNQGLSQAGSSLVEGAQSGRRLQQQIALNERQFAQSRALQNQRLEVQERIANSRMNQPAPFPNQTDDYIDPVTGLRYFRVFNPNDSRGVSVLDASRNPVTDPDIIGRLRFSRGFDQTTNETEKNDRTAFNAFAERVGNARQGVVLSDILNSLADARASGNSIPARVGELFAQIGITLPESMGGINPTLQQLRNYFSVESNQQDFRRRIEGLQPISNVDVTSAMVGLLSPTSTPETFRAAADRLRRDSQRLVEDSEAWNAFAPDEQAARRLFGVGGFTRWQMERDTKRARDLINGDARPLDFGTNGRTNPPSGPAAGQRGGQLPPFGLRSGSTSGDTVNAGNPRQSPPPRQTPQGPPAPSGFVPGETSIDAPPPPAPPPPRPGFNSMEPQRQDFPPGWQGDVAHWNAMRRWRTENPNSRFPGATR
jgi:hypothetical protein